jgi:hypothetical protein
MTNTQLKTQIDTDVTNKTLVKSLSNVTLGNDMKALVDYVDQQVATVSTGGVRELRGFLDQSGTSAPTMTIFKNDFSGAITMARTATGIYSISIAGLTSSDYLTKSFYLVGSGNNPVSSRNEMTIGTDGVGTYWFSVYSISVPGNTPSDSFLARTSFQIIVKN